MLLVRSVITVLLGLCACSGQEVQNYEGNDQSVVLTQKYQDVSILKQIHRHNEDGSYTYGYETSDGSYKIETKTRTGEVTGKYGYIDDLGKLRVVEYGANKYGFQPSGDGITVPSPTLVELRQKDEQDEQPLRPVNRPSFGKPRKPLSRNWFKNDEIVQPQLISNTIRSLAVNFNESDESTARVDEPHRSTVVVKPPKLSRQSSSYRSAEGYSGGSTAARAKSLPHVIGSFQTVPDEAQIPSESYESVQEFGDKKRTSGKFRPSFIRPLAVDHSYQTYEDQEKVTEPPTSYQTPVYKQATKRNGGSSTDGYRTVSRQIRTGDILDQLSEQYA